MINRSSIVVVVLCTLSPLFILSLSVIYQKTKRKHEALWQFHLILLEQKMMRWRFFNFPHYILQIKIKRCDAAGVEQRHVEVETNKQVLRKDHRSIISRPLGNHDSWIKNTQYFLNTL